MARALLLLASWPLLGGAEDSELRYVLDAADEPPVAYSWDGGPEVPFEGAPGATLVWGEAGIVPETRLYLSFEAWKGAPRDLGPQERELTGEGFSTAEGRFGAGLAFAGADSGLVVEPASSGTPPLLDRSFTVGLWLRPLAGGPATVLEAPGRVRLDLDENGVPVAAFAGEPPRVVRGATTLEPGRWTHLAVVADSLLGTVRLSVDGRTTGALTTPAGPVADARLKLGGLRAVLDDVSVTARAATSTELEEGARAEPEPGPHELRLRTADGERRVRLWGRPLRQPALLTPGHFARGELYHAGPEPGPGGRGLTWFPAHWERVRAPSPPPARTTHPTVYVGERRFLIFGGETRDTHLDGFRNTADTWLFRTDLARWARVGSSPSPPPSCHQPAAWSPDHGLVLYAGGWRNDAGGPATYDGTWLFHVDEGRWEEREPAGVPFPPRRDCNVVYHPPSRRFLVFLSGTDRVLAYDPEANRWDARPRATSVDERGEPALYRVNGAMCAFDPASGEVLLHGGVYPRRGEVVYHDRTALYDAEQNRFLVLDPRRAPAPRVRAGFAHDSKRGRFVLFGGVLGHDSERFGDLWSFDPRTRAWRSWEASDPPSPRGGYYGMAYDPDDDRFYLACGRHARERFLNEVVALHLDEAAVGRATYVFDREGFPERDRWGALWFAPGDAGVTFRFRAGRDGIAWGEWGTSARQVVGPQARFVEVEVTLTPGSAGEVPVVLAMGFADPSIPLHAPHYERALEPVSPLER